MGDGVLILAFVVIVIGGIGSIRGAFVARAAGRRRRYARPRLPAPAAGQRHARTAADNAGPALASMLIYILMAVVLSFRPAGLFPPRGR